MYRYEPSIETYTKGLKCCFSWDCGPIEFHYESETLRKLLSKGVDPNLRTRSGYTPLYTVVYNYGTINGRGLVSDLYVYVKMFLDAGADPNILPSTARRKNYPTLIQLVRDKYYKDPNLTAYRVEMYKRVEKLLLSRGAKP